MERYKIAAKWNDITLLSTLQLSETIIGFETMRLSIQGCEIVKELFRHLSTYYGDLYSILDNLVAEIKGRNYVQVKPGQSSRSAMIIIINKLQESLFSKTRYFKEHKLT